MGETTFIGVFPTETDALQKTEELKIAGYSDKDIFVITNNGDSLAIVRRPIDAPLTETDVIVDHHFVDFVGGDGEVRKALIDMGFPDNEAARYYNQVKLGDTLLYVNRQYDNLVHSEIEDTQGH